MRRVFFAETFDGRQTMIATALGKLCVKSSNLLSTVAALEHLTRYIVFEQIGSHTQMQVTMLWQRICRAIKMTKRAIKAFRSTLAAFATPASLSGALIPPASCA